ncbi:hypothetical protein PI126_g16764 [Phytophthora idaei]|nr:hypothetical protein PI126_g16764 [Phytophthora idaei]
MAGVPSGEEKPGETQHAAEAEEEGEGGEREPAPGGSTAEETSEGDGVGGSIFDAVEVKESSEGETRPHPREETSCRGHRRG